MDDSPALAAPTPTTPTTPAGPSAPTAPVWRRVLAWAVDWTAWGLFVAACALVGRVLPIGSPATAEDALSDAQAGGLEAGIAILAVAWVAMLARGTTPGLALLSVRLVRRDGRPPGLLRALVRWLVPAALRVAAFAAEAVLLFVAAFTGGTGLLIVLPLVAAIEAVRHIPQAWALFRQDRRTLYDLLAGTWVVMRP